MSQAVDPYAVVLENRFAAEPEESNVDRSALNLSAKESKAADLENALKRETQKLAQGPQAPKPPPTGHPLNGLLLVVALLLGAALVLRKTVALLNGRYDPWALSPTAAASVSAKLRAEDEALSEFVLTFQTGPTVLSGHSPFIATTSVESEPVKEFFAKAPEILGELGKLLQKISATTNEPARRSMLTDLHRELGTLKGAAGHSELLPVWQMAAAVEGLIKQLADRAGNITPSTLRTLAGGVDLLKGLCVRGLRSDLLTNPPIRLLAVDDDLISRKAVSLALKKALNQPDLAENGEQALALATMHAYDAIFLDVQMPGMDGFELCTHIHKTVPNAETPVVFVTCMSDFAARAQSVISGGSDLIGKPFLTFEITVKALTLILQARLRAPAQSVSNQETANGISAPQPCMLLNRPVPASVSGPVLATANTALLETSSVEARQNGHITSTPSNLDAAAPGELSPEELMTQAFLARAATQLGALRDRVQMIFQVSDENTRQEMLTDLYLRLHSLMPATDPAQGHPALRMLAALEGLLKKLLQNPKNCTSSTLFTLATAVDVLSDLCANGVRSDLATNPPIRMLVADDDPVARRAITCALQTAFEKPEAVECGETALAAAKEKPFDVIFLDVQMPRMDGFTASTKIREAGRNRTTPVVFVTGQSDFKSRTQATLSGGNDLMGKPFLTAEVTVKALTFALRGRLRKHRTGAHWQTAAGEAFINEAAASGGLSGRADERREARRRARRFKPVRQSWRQTA